MAYLISSSGLSWWLLQKQQKIKKGDSKKFGKIEVIINIIIKSTYKKFVTYELIAAAALRCKRIFGILIL
jgi:hypothetical protein